MKFRKKPVVVEAFQYDGDFVDTYGDYYIPLWARQSYLKGDMYFKIKKLYIKTLEGEMLANVGDYIIKGVQGEIYPCKPDIFEMTYELVDEKTDNGEISGVAEAIKESMPNISIWAASLAIDININKGE